MRTYSLALAAAFALGAAIPAFAQAPGQTTGNSPSQGGPRDTGNMAYPTPLTQGNVTTTAPARTRDTSSNAFPAPLPQGNVSTTTTGRPNRPTDTGNMAYPAPAPQGTTSSTTVK